ncbi:putative efflux pump antibiotic resistance protein [Tricladium varicosporioides]|nr:putative efflux pump antibiotic resistance protein [Hymenoscyphus varicosporioides]
MEPQSPELITKVAISIELEMTPMPKESNLFLVAFVQPHDAENPLDWSTSWKWSVTDVLSATGFNRIMVSAIMAPALPTIARELNMTTVESAMALSIYLLASAFGPFVSGPLSEIYGREVILHASNIWFLIWNIACGFANSKELFIGSRFLAGFGASAIYTLAGGVLSDVWRPEQRGHSLSVYLMVPLLGACIGPIIGGFMAARTTWRWMFWSTSIFQGVMIIVSFFTFRETYGPVILQRRADRLRRQTGNQQYRTLYEQRDGNKSTIELLGRALTRPARLLVFHPIIQITAIISGFNYGLLYIVLSTFSNLWISRYHQPVEISGLHYIAISLGEMAGSQLGGFLMDFLFQRRKTQNTYRSDSIIMPESRLPLMFPGVIVGMLGLLLYGWTAEYKVHWLAVDAGIFVAMFGGQMGGMPITAYVIDSYPSHTGSALAATQFIKSLTAFLFPLFAPRMYEALGYRWGNGTLAFTGLVLGIPLPLVLWRYGGRLRARAISSY